MTNTGTFLKDIPFLFVDKAVAMHSNKTKKYLLPILKFYGADFVLYANNACKVACGIGDSIAEKVGLEYQKHLFIVFNSKIAPEYFIKFLNWIREQPYYTDDYVYGNILKSPFHMVVLEIPLQFNDSFDNFKKGKYSKMYEKKDMDQLFLMHPDLKGVFLRNPEMKMEFLKRVNLDFGTELDDFEGDFEVDYPISLTEEKF
jgi:hypothetical protein